LSTSIPVGGRKGGTGVFVGAGVCVGGGVNVGLGTEAGVAGGRGVYVGGDVRVGADVLVGRAVSVGETAWATSESEALPATVCPWSWKTMLRKVTGALPAYLTNPMYPSRLCSA